MANEAEEIARLRVWLEANLGEVLSVSRQARWRPSWYARVRKASGEELSLYIRGDRVDMPLVFPLDHEMRLQDLMHRHGIPTPEVHGWIDEPMSYVMDEVDGQVDFVGVSEAERDAVVDDYLQILARLHKLPLQPFVEGGIMRADNPRGVGMLGIGRYEAIYRRVKSAPEPYLEFCLNWLHRNPPDTKGREAVVVWDSGQFIHDKSRVRAVIDVEIGHIGDPMMDLAGWRQRDTVMGYGDFAKLYARYAELTGAPVDLDAIRKYHFQFCLSTRLPLVHSLRNPPPGSDLTQNLVWCGETDIFAIEALADILQIELPEVETPEPVRSRATPAFNQLVDLLRAAKSEDEQLQYALRKAFRLARHTQRIDEIGASLIEADLDDIHQLIGRRPADWFEGEAELERFVHADAEQGRHTEALVRLFYKRNRRTQMLNGPAGSAVARHAAIQPFR